MSRLQGLTVRGRLTRDGWHDRFAGLERPRLGRPRKVVAERMYPGSVDSISRSMGLVELWLAPAKLARVVG